MYDARREPNEFVADSLDEAKAKAATFFGTEESELRIVVPPSGEIFGAAGRTVIVAVPKGVKPASARRGGEERESRGDDRGEERERGGRGGRRGRGERAERGDRGDRGDRDRDRGGDRGDRDRGGDRGERSEGRSRRGRGDRDADRGERPAPREMDRLGDETPRAVADSKGRAQGKIGPIGEFLLGAVERMKLGSFEISEASEGDFLIYQLRGPAAEALQRGDGRATDALQLVANQVSMRQSEDAPRIVVDVEGVEMSGSRR